MRLELTSKRLLAMLREAYELGWKESKSHQDVELAGRRDSVSQQMVLKYMWENEE